MLYCSTVATGASIWPLITITNDPVSFLLACLLACPRYSIVRFSSCLLQIIQCILSQTTMASSSSSLSVVAMRFLQSLVLHEHYFFLSNRDFNLITRAGLMEQLVNVLEHAGHRRERDQLNTSSDDDDTAEESVAKKRKTSHDLTTHPHRTTTAGSDAVKRFSSVCRRVHCHVA